MRSLASYAIVLLLGCQTLAAWGQSPIEHKALPLPAAKHGQPVFSSEGDKRVTVQKSNPTGLHEYAAGDSQRGSGTGIVEMGRGSSPNQGGTGITELSKVPTSGKGKGIGEGFGPGTRAVTGSDTGIIVAPAASGNLVDKNALTGSPATNKNKTKPATTVVQILGPDGKMQYKEVPFMGTLSANKRAPNITDVKDGEGKVKEYEWAKHRH